MTPRLAGTEALLMLAGLLLLPAASDARLAATGADEAATPVEPLNHATFMLWGKPPAQGMAVRATAPAGAQQVLLDGAPLPLAPGGHFLIGFDRDAPATARLTAVLAGGRTVEQTVPVAPGQWRIERINAPYRGSATSDADFVRRRAGELAQINSARGQNQESDGWRQDFIWPLRGHLSGWFGSQRVYQGKPGAYHSGLDIAAPTGTPFVAPADGVVVLAADAPFTLEGHLLIVDHGMGLTSAFLHAARLDVTVGQAVRQGQPLGAVGATGRATGPHLHWGLRWRNARLDPLPLLPG
jgi:Peptidase family M23